MKTALLISTYNWVSALRLVLTSLAGQTRLPDEVLIADDGSTDETAEAISEFSNHCPIPVKHFWQPDEGFRKSMIINKAIAATDVDYIIEIDGDIVMSRHFVEDHINVARRGYFVLGSRVRFDEELTKRIEASGVMPNIYPWTKGILSKLEKTVRIPLVNRFSHHYKRNKNTAQGCNFAFWREDYIRVNGYDEHFVGWGCEDTDLSLRLRLAGVQNFKLLGSGIVYHLWHKEYDKSNFDEALKYMSENTNRSYICEKGISQYLNGN